SGDVVAQQIAACLSDIGVDAVKIGMLHDREIISATAEALTALPEEVPVILDPVMIATSGAALIAPEAIAALRSALFPLATLLTPNLPELGHLVGRSLSTSDHMIEAAQELSAQTGAAVLAKGGHTADDRIIDMLIQPGRDPGYFDHARIATSHTHGTGCTLSSAIATLLAHGQGLDNAVRLGRNFVLRAIESAPGYGAGNGPLGHYAVRSIAD
ncbi:MAG: hydroxymethylpyrimidine/phosphomethylpyrimidine kinase, partial [Erythrobacter sp.]|nr:hydroxymethylpyrimidine/phosphomethylpyrimidine kinase [Erythrobacter sp.]